MTADFIDGASQGFELGAPVTAGVPRRLFDDLHDSREFGSDFRAGSRSSDVSSTRIITGWAKIIDDLEYSSMTRQRLNFVSLSADG